MSDPVRFPPEAIEAFVAACDAMRRHYDTATAAYLETDRANSRRAAERAAYAIEVERLAIDRERVALERERNNLAREQAAGAEERAQIAEQRRERGEIL